MFNDYLKKWLEISPYCKELQGMLEETPRASFAGAVSDSFDTVKSFAKIRKKIENIIDEPLDDYATAWRGGEFSLVSHRQNVARLEAYLRDKYCPKTDNIKEKRDGLKGELRNTVTIKLQQGLLNFSGTKINNVVKVAAIVFLAFSFFFFLSKLKYLLGL